MSSHSLVVIDGSQEGQGALAIPRCLFPLATVDAQQEYRQLATAFQNAGKLTAKKHRLLSGYVLQFDQIHLALAQLKPVRASRFDQLTRALATLQLEDLDTSTSAAAPERPNKFARCGFSSSRR